MHADDVTARHARHRAADHRDRTRAPGRRSDWRSRRPATRAATPCCSTATSSSSRATTSPGRGAAAHLVAFRDANWYSWPETIRSMERLLDFEFEWVLPGHGERFRAESPAAMRREARALRRLDEATRVRLCGRRDAARPRSPGFSAATSSSRPPDSRPSASRTAGVFSGGARITTQPPPPAPHAFPAQAPADRSLRRSPLRCPARTRPARAAGAPPTRAAAPSPSPGSRPPDGLGHLAGRVADLVEARRDEMVALQARAEDLPVVHSRGVRGPGVEERQVPEPCRRGRPRAGRPRRVPAGSAACAGRRRAAGSSPGCRRACRARASRRRARTRPRPSPSNGRSTLAARAATIATVSADDPPRPEPKGTSRRKLDLARLVDPERLEHRPGERRRADRPGADRGSSTVRS